MSRTMRLPDIGEGVVEAELVAWLVEVGDEVTAETPIAEIATDKATVEISAPVAGTVSSLLIEPGQIVAVGTEILVIGGAEAPTAAVAADNSSPATEPQPGPEPQPELAPRPAPPSQESGPAEAVSPGSRPARPIAAPTVRRLARELDIDLATVRGTGPEGRILREDVETHRAGPSTATSVRRPDQVVPVRGIRRTIANRLTTAWEAPHITLVDDVDMTEVEGTRAALNDELDDAGRRTTPLAFIARAVVLACADHPACNATYDVEAETVTQHGAVHLGIATQTDRGLVVPVLRDADRASLTGLADGIRELSAATREGRAAPGDLSGSTITISSLGALGGLMNTPILNAPEVSVVGVNKMRTEPVWNGSSFVPREVMNLSASFDHRIIDGWDAAVFLRRVKQLLETPALLALGWSR